MPGTVRRKNYRIDVTKLERARKALGTRSETETIHRALEMVANEAGLARALRNLIVKGRGRIEDIDADGISSCCAGTRASISLLSASPAKR